jgi:hypothetical protein
VVLQAKWRQVLAFRTRQEEIGRHTAANVICCAWKRHQWLSAIRCRSAVLIQKRWRRLLCMIRYIMTMMDITAIQCLFRRRLAMRLLRRRKQAARIIQRNLYRRVIHCRLVKERISAATKCQVRSSARCDLKSKLSSKSSPSPLFVIRIGIRSSLPCQKRSRSTEEIQSSTNDPGMLVDVQGLPSRDQNAPSSVSDTSWTTTKTGVEQLQSTSTQLRSNSILVASVSSSASLQRRRA